MQGEQWRRVGGQVEGGQRPGGSNVGTSDVPSANVCLLSLWLMYCLYFTIWQKRTAHPVP